MKIVALAWIARAVLGSALTLAITMDGIAAERCSIAADIPAAPALRDTKVDTAVFDLQLVYSWSPHYCKSIGAGTTKLAMKGGKQAKDKVKDKKVAAWDADFQCRRNDFGFVVHGLWPQAEGATGREGQPRACAPATPLPPEVIRQHLCTVPGVHLMQNEWMAHGTCHWKAPEEYFGDIETLVANYPMPDLQSLQGRDVTVDEIVAAIVDGSKGKLDAGMIGVRAASLANRRSLQEVYICLDLAYQPKACPSRGTPGHLNAFVWPVPRNNAP